MSKNSTTWTDEDGEYIRCGITKRSCHEIGEIVWIQLPEIGSSVEKDELVAVVESTKAAFDIYSPISGKIIEVNHALFESLELLNKDPEASGWLFKCRK
jgi:glycine cleavage system H protein